MQRNGSGAAVAPADDSARAGRGASSLNRCGDFTNCPANDTRGQLREELGIEARQRALASARAGHEGVDFKGVPIMYCRGCRSRFGPTERKAALPLPTPGHSSRSGLQASRWPFYWNIAPNWGDATFEAPRNNRPTGALDLGGDLRLLTQNTLRQSRYSNFLRTTALRTATASRFKGSRNVD